MTPQLRAFYLNWLGKADNYTDDSLANHFDKFTSLYVVFNSLYMDIMTELVLSGTPIAKDFKEKRAATEYVIQYLKSRFYIEKLLNDEPSTNSLAQICRIMEANQFNIILYWGVHQRDLDLTLLNLLQSNKTPEKGKAILSLFYHVRCNLFHGHKGFEERQRELLVPVNQLLRKTVEIAYNKLNNSMN